MTKIFKGCELVDVSELAHKDFLPQVEKTNTFYPLPHIGFYMNASLALVELGIGIVSSSFGLSPKRDRMFMWLETDAIVEGMPLCIGGRNSYDKSMSAGLCVGTKIMVCSNKVLASYENGGVVSKKHTSVENIGELSKEFTELVKTQIDNHTSKTTFFDSLYKAKNRHLDYLDAKATLTDLVLTNSIVPTDIKPIWTEYVEPRHESFKNYYGTPFGLLMAATEVFKLHQGVDYQIKAYDGLAKALGL